MKKIIKTAMAMLLTMALLLPTFAVQASAASYKWNGTSTLKAGNSYVVSTAVTMDSKFTVPEGAKLTVSKTGSLTISKGVTATVKGTLAVSKGGTLKVNGTLNTSEEATVKISGKLTYGASAKMKLNGKLTVSSTGTVSGSGTAEVNLSATSQYNSDINKINTYLEKNNYSKACSLLESAIAAYPTKAASLRKAYSSAVIDWANQLADEKNYAKACSILNSAKKHLTDTTDVQNRYEFYQGYIPVPLKTLKNWGATVSLSDNSDNFGNIHSDSFSLYDGYYLEYMLNGKYTNLSAIIVLEAGEEGGPNRYIEVFVDGVSVYVSDSVYNTTTPFAINVDITGAEKIKIVAHSVGYEEIILADATVYKE